MRRALLLAGLLLLAAPLDAEEPISLRVTPKVALAPADIEIRATFVRDPANRLFSVTAESRDFYRRSEISVPGSAGPKTFVFRYRDLPEGDYDVTAILETANGKTTSVTERLKLKP
jgi:hypothetical protein